MLIRSALLVLFVGWRMQCAAADFLGPIWLSHALRSPATVTVAWESIEAVSGRVAFGPTPDLGQETAELAPAARHHVEIPLFSKGTCYRIRTPAGESGPHFTPGYEDDELRVAIAGNLGFAQARPWAAAIAREKPHLFLTAGDNVAALHDGSPVGPETTSPFTALVVSAPELFRSTRFLPILGNHDREIRPRGPRPPEEPVYDVSAAGFRKFFALPDEEWRWHLDLPAFGVRFIAVDLSHLSDMGTTWQTCHSFAQTGPQFGWFRDRMREATTPFVVSLYNERHATVRGLEGGEWGRLIRQGSLAVSGFGYFGERAEVDGFPYFNTSANGTGAQYPDPKSAALFRSDNFLVLRFTKEPFRLVAELKDLEGKLLDRREIAPRQGK